MTGHTASDVPGSRGRGAPPDWPAVAPAGIGAATTVLVVAIAGFLVAAVGLSIRLMPRHFTLAQQQQITAWELSGRWRDLPAGQIFPETVGYAPPAQLNGTGGQLTLAAHRLGIAPQAPCWPPGRLVTDGAASAVLNRNGCEAVLRATYTDTTGTYVATLGVVPLPSPDRAETAGRELGAKRLRMPGGRAPGVRALPVAGTLAASFADSRRQLTASVVEGPYLVMYAVGYTDGRPLVPVAADSYADAEMTSFGTGVARRVADALGTSPTAPGCPGAPGC